MLDGNKDSLKLDAMKRIIGMIAKGRNASDLFPAVVKNVVSKNVEVTIKSSFKVRDRPPAFYLKISEIILIYGFDFL